MLSKHPIKLHQTLAFRLTLWYAGIFTVSAGAAFFFFYLLITGVFRNYTDQELSNQVNHFSRLLSAKGIDAVKRVAVLEAQAGGEKKIFIRLLYLNGQVFSSSNMSYWRDIGIKRALITQVIRYADPVFETIDIRNRKHQVRILYGIIGPDLILQLGRSMENTTRFIEAFQKIFITTMLLLVIAAAGVGWFMAKRALSGVSAVTRTARRIAGGALEQRVPVKPRGDEIDQLATTFNKMLDRIQTLVTGIREMNDNIAHDLRSPITRIRGLAEVTFTTGKSLGDYENMTASTIEECDRLLDMINTMLVISEIEAGCDIFHPKKLNLSEIVREACTLFQPIAEDSGIELRCRAVDNHPIYADTPLIQRMIANILDNAVKYTPDGGTISVSIRSNDDDTTSISIEDTGMGISDEDLPHIFKRFYRCDTSRANPGNGLGLSLSQAIARAHGGGITVSGNPKTGSLFTIRLPKSPPVGKYGIKPDPPALGQT